MASIQSLGISGIRGYSSQKYQKIQFMKPLTLIWGKNGSGKTTIIQCLKFITTGTLPPNSDKGKSFVMDPKVAGKPQVIGDIRLIFKIGNRPILVKRRVSVSSTSKGTKFQSIEQVLKTKNQNGQDLTINHQCAEIQKQVPHFLSISKSILENIVFCHQDQSLWPFGDSNTLKGIFDQLFQTKKFSDLMQLYWQEKKNQQTQLKQLKIRLEYQKATFHKNMNEQKKLMQQLAQIQMKTLQLVRVRKQIKKLKKQLKDNSQKVQQRQKLIYRKGTLQHSLRTIQEQLKRCKRHIIQLNRSNDNNNKTNYNSQKMQIQQQPNIFSNYKSYNNSNIIKISQHQVQKLTITYHKSTQYPLQLLQQGKQTYKQLLTKYNQIKDHLQILKNYTQLNKRQRQIKSQIDRIKDIIPEMKSNKNIKNDQEFLSLLKIKVENMEDKIKGIKVANIKLENMIIPNLVENGLMENQIDKCKKDYRQLQVQIKRLSVSILRIYQIQYKSLPNNIDISQFTIKKYQLQQSQLKNISAVISSKQQQLLHFQSLPKKSKTNLQQQIDNYKYTGIDLQTNMLEFCQKKKKCYFCMRAMDQSQIQNAKKNVQSIKGKTQEKIAELQRKKKNQSTHDYIDPQMMIKKITEELKKLRQKQTILKQQIKKYQKVKQHQTQYKKNSILSKQLQKCKLNINMLNQMGYNPQKDPRPRSQYQQINIDQYKQFCSQYLITLQKYKSIKNQISKIQQNQQKNKMIAKQRQQMLKQKQQLQISIKNGQEQIKNYDFVKNSYKKLDTLIKLNIKSKNTRQNNNKNKISSQDQKNSVLSSLNTVQQAQAQIDRLNRQMINQKYENQKLQIEIQYSTKLMLLQQQKQKFKQLDKQLLLLSKQLQTSQKIIHQYNQLSHFYDKQSQKHRSRATVINHALNQLSQKQYLITLRKIKNYQQSISNIQLAYRALQQSISSYHSQKMQQINRYIYQTWRDIYHGDDIDYIEIQSSAEKDSRKKKKNYFYKILMKKNTKNFKNSEKVQMKGRCSMGQKVLASIVIRLALAEVFCSRARILALDQPTTNLDREHIRNLADALLRLIQLSGGRNLQLIIISHDIQFIKMLQEYADSCFEISRDDQKFSQIQKKQLKDVFIN